MINFKDVVLSYLEETDAPSGWPSEIRNNSIAAYIANSATAFNARYRTAYDLPDKEAFRNIVGLLNSNWTRQSDKKFSPFAKYFVIFDFLAYVYEKSSSPVVSPKTDFFLLEDPFADVDKELEALTNSFFDKKTLYDDPLEVNPSSNFGLRLQLGLKMIAGENLGKEVFRGSDYQNFNIEQCIYALIAARQNNRKKILNLTKVPVPQNEIRQLFLTSDAAGGKKPIPTDALKKYSENFSRELMSLGVTARQLWDYERQKYLSDDWEKTANTFENFIKNIPLTPNIDVPESTDKITAYTFKTSGEDKPANIKGAPGDKGYIIKNIITMSESGKNSAALNFVNKLYAFADYVHAGEPRNLVGKLQATAGALGDAAKAFGARM